MIVKKGFYLIDCVTALAVSLLAMSAVIQLGIQNQQHLFRDWESRVAREILDHIHTLPREVLDTLPDRYFDVRGLPADHEGKFKLRILTETSERQRRYRCTLTWMDADERNRTLSLERVEEAPDE